MDKIAFLGLGTMGAGMAGRVAASGFPLNVWNRSPERAGVFNGRAQLSATPADAAADADIVICMLADDAASRATWLGAGGALSRARRGTRVVGSRTLSPAWIIALAASANAAGCELLDAPVTGSKAQAASGELRFLVGGSAATVERATPVLKTMGTDIVHVGPIASGARLKLINNFLCGVQAASLAEAVAVVERSGLDRDAALAVLFNGAPGSPLVKGVGARMAKSDYTVNFSMNLLRKDLTYAIDEALLHGVPLTTVLAARELFSRATELGLGDRDFSAVVELTRKS
jgi:3-hydroxyisobutyrate dehydrogenase